MRKILDEKDFKVGASYWRRKIGKLENGDLHAAQVVELDEVSGRKCFQPNRFWLDSSTLKEYEFVGPIDDPFKSFSIAKDESIPLHEYLDKEGNICPFCGSGEVEANGAVEIDGLIGTQRVDCVSCEHSWDDKYRLISFEER